MRPGVVLLLLLSGVARAGPNGTVGGRVLDPDGKALPGVVVTAYCVSSKEPSSRTAKTGEDGRFLLADLPAGEYILDLGAPPAPPPKGNTPEQQIADALAGVLMGGLAHSLRCANAKGHPHFVVVQAGASVEHDIRVPRKVPVTLVFEHRGRPVTGKAVDLIGVDARGKPGWRMTSGDDRPFRTDASGTITFPEVPEGRYAVFVEVGDWEVRCGLVDVAGKEPVRLPVVLGPHEARVRVLDGRGDPVLEAEVSLWVDGRDWVGVAPRDFGEVWSRTGVYEVSFLVEGSHRVCVNVGCGHALAGPFDVGAGNPPEVVVRMDPMGSMVVRVTDAAGDPVREAHVRALRVSDGAGIGEYTNRRGKVRFDDLTTGKWRVGLSGGGIDDFRGEPREVEVRGFEETLVELTR